MHSPFPIAAAAATALALIALPAAPAEKTIPTGNIVLTLEGALGGGGDSPAELELEVPARDGAWPETLWGKAFWYNRGQHEGRIVEQGHSDGVHRLTIELEIGRDYWKAGGEARYELELRMDEEGRGFTGSYRGRFTQIDTPRPVAPRRGPPPGAQPPRRDLPPALLERFGRPEAQRGQDADDQQAEAQAEDDRATGEVLGRFDVAGNVRGRVDPPWPGVVADHRPVEPGEHPRLLFRRHDLAVMKQRAEATPEGRAIMQRFMQVVDEPGPVDSDKFLSWPGVSYGFAWQMTGDRTYLEKARRLMRDLFLHRGASGGQDIHHAPRLMGLALTYDLCHDGWDEDFRRAIAQEIRQRVLECATGTFQGNTMGGFNPNWWSNKNGIRAACAGIGALAIMHERDADGDLLLPEAEQIAQRSAREVRGFLRYALGGSGWCMEGEFYKGMTIRRGLLPFVLVYRTAMGKDIVDVPMLGDFVLAGHLLESTPGPRWEDDARFNRPLSRMGVDGERMDDILWTLAMVTVPRDMLPGVRWVHERSVGIHGSGTFGIGLGFYAPFVMATFPFDVEPEHPDKSLRWMAPDPWKGHYVFRPTFRDERDILLTTNFNSETFFGAHYNRAGPTSHLRLHGLGRAWLDGVQIMDVDGRGVRSQWHGPRVTVWDDPEPRIHVMSMDALPLYLSPLDERTRRLIGPGSDRLVRIPSRPQPLLHPGFDARRAMAVDASGRSGAPFLVAIMDRVAFEDEPQPTSWRLPFARGTGSVRGDGRRYSVGPRDGPGLSGILLHEGGRIASDATVKDATLVWTVFILHEGEAPEIEVEGVGADATVRIGDRRIRLRDDAFIVD